MTIVIISQKNKIINKSSCRTLGPTANNKTGLFQVQIIFELGENGPVLKSLYKGLV